MGTVASHRPTYTVYIDRPEKIAKIWPAIDELTASHGVVTSLLVPGYRERAGDSVQGALELPQDIATLWRLRQESEGDRNWAAGEGAQSRSDWTGEFLARALEFANKRGRREPVVRATTTERLLCLCDRARTERELSDAVSTPRAPR